MPKKRKKYTRGSSKWTSCSSPLQRLPSEALTVLCSLQFTCTVCRDSKLVSELLFQPRGWFCLSFFDSSKLDAMSESEKKGKGSSNIKLLFLEFIKFLPRILNFSIYYFVVFLIKASLQSPLSIESLHSLMYLCKYTYPYPDRLTAVCRNQFISLMFL